MNHDQQSLLDFLLSNHHQGHLHVYVATWVNLRTRADKLIYLFALSSSMAQLFGTNIRFIDIIEYAVQNGIAQFFSLKPSLHHREY